MKVEAEGADGVNELRFNMPSRLNLVRHVAVESVSNKTTGYLVGR